MKFNSSLKTVYKLITIKQNNILKKKLKHKFSGTCYASPIYNQKQLVK